MLDVGCGTGYFTRRLASDGFNITGIDASAEMTGYAHLHAIGCERYMTGDARHLPFSDRHFDSCVAITSLCFIHEQEQALAEMMRVTRRRIVLGLLNRHSLLYWRKGRRGGRGAYRGAHWHTACEARALFARAELRNVVLRSAIYLPGGNVVARSLETAVPQGLLFGGFLLIAGDIA